MRTSRLVLIPAAALAFAAPLTACSSDDATESAEVAPEETAAEATAESTEQATEAADSSPVNVVATTTMLGDVAAQIVTCANPESTATTLMPIGADPHDFSPSSAQVAEMVQANVVIANGLGLEAGLDDALENAASDGATVIEIADLVDPIPFGEDGHDDHDDEAKEEDHDDDHSDGDHSDGDHSEDEHSHDEAKEDDHDHDHSEDEHSHDEAKEDDHDDDHSDEAKDDDHDDHGDHGHGDEDPHFWFDMNRMATAAQIIGDELATDSGQVYADCGAQVADDIRAAEADVRALLESVPADQRILVTDHDALGYLSDAYGYEVAGTVIPAGTTLAEPSSADLAELVEVMQDEGVRVIFTNTADPSALADAVAAEVGGDVQVVQLYVGSLGEPGSGADTYIGMMQT
ncbi:MAG TPA: metal ABC transporter substrate-binding protein, partial [Candidatus Nanopelagicales bacterium]|nr:metal ABC transporter substrate-binding protein [Candidatus Nanopelagicales bacterium]